MSQETRQNIQKIILIIITLYLFLLSIKLLGHSFKLFGRDFAEAMLQMTANPFIGLVSGIVATSLVQSSSTTTSIVVGLVAGGGLSLTSAIPIIMGANIGTSITNTMVSMGHVTNRVEFRRAFSAGIVHDFFNVCSVLLFFPIELKFHLLARTATAMEHVFSDAGGMKLFNPLKAILNPAINLIDQLVTNVPYKSVILLVVALIIMFWALIMLVRILRSLMLNKLEILIQNYLFRNDVLGVIVGLLMTILVQSSSITTSLIVPLAGAGIVSLRQIFPYTLGANLGTTITAMLAAMATQNHVAVTVAFAHLWFNIYGMAVFYPLKFIPIGLTQIVGERATRSKRNMAIFIVSYLALYFIPVVLIFI